jgi:hypothetical protein
MDVLDLHTSRLHPSDNIGRQGPEADLDIEQAIATRQQGGYLQSLRSGTCRPAYSLSSPKQAAGHLAQPDIALIQGSEYLALFSDACGVLTRPGGWRVQQYCKAADAAVTGDNVKHCRASFSHPPGSAFSGPAISA